jgi:quercetin dioxygenase-like cupin family protein
MSFTRAIPATLLCCAALVCQTASTKAVLANLSSAKWSHEAGDPPGSESVVLREDAATGATELLVRYPAGHVFHPHWHNANERVLLLEGKMSVNGTTLDSGGYAFLPAKEVQRIACISSTRCTFYVYWDAKLDFHRAE